MLSVTAMVPWGKTDGIILHNYVDDVPAAVDRAVAAGAELLDGPLKRSAIPAFGGRPTRGPRRPDLDAPQAPERRSRMRLTLTLLRQRRR